MKHLPTQLLVLLGFLLLPALSMAQVSGQNPLLLLNRNNGYQLGVGTQPVVNGDLLGRFQIRGWVSDGFYHPGAQISSVVTGPVNGDGFPANLLIATGYPSLTTRIAITNEGLVGIGTEAPAFDLHTVGNTHTTGNFWGRLHIDDNQATDDAPNTYTDEAYFELKQRAVLGLPAGMGAHGGLLTLAPGAGSNDHQLFFGDDGLFHRRWDGGAGSWAGSVWHKLLSGEDINGTPNRIAKFTGPNAIGDSQLWDDGAQVGIGTDAPAAGFRLHVAGATRLGGKVAIGTGNMPNMLGANNTGGYNLYVSGGILTEEVLVRTGWADYVFEKDYPLPSLEAVEQHIQQKGHLPGVPSAAEVEANGLGLAENALNQQVKIEELFLHLIELNKELKALKAENEQLKARIDAISNQ
jgi:hypothetical protein